MDELQRIRGAYAERARSVPSDLYALSTPGQLLLDQTRERALLKLLRPLLPLDDRRVLEVGCGHGTFLAEFERWGAPRENLSGIELVSDRAEAARERLPGADIREGNAGDLPWEDGSHDVVIQSLVLSSILDADLRAQVCGEMARVVAPGGAIVSYDFFVGSPRNAEVRRLGRRELASLFPGFRMTARRITLAPPLARALAPRAWVAAELLEATRLFNTHLLVRFERP